MKIVKKYWWVGAVIVGAFLVYWFVFRKDASISSKTGACTTTAAEWNQKMIDTEASIRSNSTWLAGVADKVGTGKPYSTLDEAVSAYAAGHLTKTVGLCKPA